MNFLSVENGPTRGVARARKDWQNPSRFRVLHAPGGIKISLVAAAFFVLVGAATARPQRPPTARTGSVATTPNPATRATSSQPLVMGETFTLTSAVLGEVRRINVYLPPIYADSPSVHLPVLYMPDGGMAEDFLHVAGLIEVLVGDGSMRPFVLVGIENTERRRDLTGPTNVAEDKKIAPHVGGSAAFRAFIRTELMPEIKRRYRTTNESAIVGESLAGLFVMETFFVEPELFDTYVAFDPSLWWNGAKLVDDASHTLRAWPAMRKTLYFASSDEKGIFVLTDRLSDIFVKDAGRDLTWHYERMPEETHGTIYHPAALRAFRALFKPRDAGR